MNNQKISLKYISIIFLAVGFTWVSHEFAHWIVYESFGFDATMTLNNVGVINGGTPNSFERIIATGAGPFITLVQGLIIYFWLKEKGWNKTLYPLLFSAFYMRFLAGVMNFIKPNDEGAIGTHLGIGLYTISIVISGLLFWMVYQITKKYKLSWKFNGLTLLLVMISSSILILLDQFITIRLL